MIISSIVILLLLLLGLSLAKSARQGDELAESAWRDFDSTRPETPLTTKA